MGIHHGNRLTGDLPVLDVDTNFASNSLLINGEGFNTQNNTFVSTPVGVGTYTGYFDGTGDYLSTPSNAAFGIDSGDFTIECWVYLNSYTSGATTDIVYGSNNLQNFHIGGTTNSPGKLGYYNGGGVSSSTGDVPLNTWTHIACTRSGTTVRLFRNGAVVGTNTMSTTSPGAISLTIGGNTTGAYLNGYISNLRIVKGTALYTSSFTVPASLLSNVTNTVLLTCQDPTFKDNSSNNFTITAVGNAAIQVASAYTITRNGNATQGSFSPYGNNWSMFFDGNGDGLNTNNATAFALSGTDFTIEAWVNLTGYSSNYTGGNYGAAICASKSSGSISNGFEFDFQGTASSYTSLAFVARNGTSNAVFLNPSFVFLLNTWYHIALVKSGSTFTFYVNGVSISSTTNANTWTNLSDLQVGWSGMTGYEYYFPGYISNFRLIKGTAVYTANFTPPTTPLTAISGTSLLTCHSNRFSDGSSNNFTITPSGDVRVTKETPFPVAPYSATVIGGSGYFDGTSDYITAPNSSNFELNSGDYTVEFWFYPNDVASVYSIFGPWTYPGGWLFQLVNNTLYFFGNGGNLSGYHSSGAVIRANAWTHVACTRSGSTSRMFINGALVSTTSVPISTSSHPLAVGCNIGGLAQFYKGYVSDARIVKGTALYTSAFTPPTTPLNAVSGTTFLCNFTNAGVVDLTGENVIETVDGAQTSTTQKKYGSKSLYFDGTGDYLFAIYAPTTDIGGKPFTVECWLNTANISSSTYQAVFSKRVQSGTSNAGLTFAIKNNGSATAWNGSTEVGTTGVTLVSNTWYHVAWVYNGTVLQIYVDGIQRYSGTYSITANSYPVQIGCASYNGSAVDFFNGYIDDFRVTKGVARYVTNFTPPTKALPNGTASTI